MLNTIADNSLQNKCTIATLIDLSKAFDCLQYNQVLTKIQHMGFTQGTVDGFKDYLKDRQQ